MKKTWFITGASRGFGRIWVEAALQRGDNVTGTADLVSMGSLRGGIDSETVASNMVARGFNSPEPL
jgi:NAD(P)-dependent dehydrogenase (short-subunit alcohol dehydrogenase family)